MPDQALAPLSDVRWRLLVLEEFRAGRMTTAELRRTLGFEALNVFGEHRAVVSARCAEQPAYVARARSSPVDCGAGFATSRAAGRSDPTKH
jgi:hypothetical protein